MTEDFKPENGQWYKTWNKLSEKIMRLELSGAEFRMLEMFRRFCHGYNRSDCSLSVKDMCDYTNLARRTVQHTLARLIKRNIIKKRARSCTYTNVTYKLNSKYDTWKSVQKRAHVQKRAQNRARSCTTPIKDNIKTTRGNAHKFAHPEWLNMRAWNEWVDFRKEIRKPLKSKTMINHQISFLAKHKAEHVEIINQSIMNGWQGLFELKGKHLVSRITDNERAEVERKAQRELDKTQELLARIRQ